MNDRVTLLAGDCLALLDTLDENSVDAIVTDPPYHLTSIVKRFGKADAAPTKGDGAAQRLSRGFMGKQWDGGDIAFREELWAKVLRVLKPGGYACAFSATRTYHRMVTAMENAGFVIQDQLDWLYGTGFPKSMDIAKAIDKTLGVEGEYGAPRSAAHNGWIKRGRMRGEEGADGWQRPWMGDAKAINKAAREYIPATDEARAWIGWGTALKPGHEPIVLAQKPLSEKTIAKNVLRWGTGALNIAACRVPVKSEQGDSPNIAHDQGRWPSNVLHDASDDVEREFAAFGESESRGGVISVSAYDGLPGSKGAFKIRARQNIAPADCGSPSRFFYSAKADDADRMGSNHPTVKPVDLMAWLVRLTTPPMTPMGVGVVLDPFAGTGTTAQAALRHGRRAIVIEREAEYLADIKRRIGHVEGADTPLFAGPENREAANENPHPESGNGGGRRVYGRFALDGKSAR